MIDFTAGDTFRFPSKTIIRDKTGAIIDLSGWTATAFIEFNKRLHKPSQAIDAHISGTPADGFVVILVKKDTDDWPAGIAKIHTTFTTPADLESDKQTAGALPVFVRRLEKVA